VYIYIYIYCNAVKDKISFTILYKLINNRHKDGYKKPKLVDDSSKFTKYFFRKDCVRLCLIIIITIIIIIIKVLFIHQLMHQ